MNGPINKYMYSIELTYSYKENGMTKNAKLMPENIISMAIHHDYDEYCMPLIYMNIAVDKGLIDKMVLGANNSVFILALYKIAKNSSLQEKIECFRKKFTYFLSSDINKSDAIEFNEYNKVENKNKTFKEISIGLLAIDHIDNNEASNEPISFTVKNATMKNIVLKLLSKINPLVIGSFSNNDILKQFILPPTNTVNSALKYLNDYRVFFSTPYRFYQDWNATYLIDSNGRALKSPGELFSSVIIRCSDAIQDHKYSDGFVINRKDKTYDIHIDITEIDVINNIIANKQMANIIGYSEKGASKIKLKNKSEVLKNKTNATKINNGNIGVLGNIKADADSNNTFVYIVKKGLDTNIFTINKKISIRHGKKHRDKDGNYLLTRKIEYFDREDGKVFNLTTALNLKKIG